MGRADRGSEERDRGLFDAWPVALWEADLSALSAALAALRDSGVADPPAWLSQRPDEALRLGELIRVVAVNRAALDLFEAPNRDSLCVGLAEAFPGCSAEAFRDIVAAVARGERTFATAAPARTRGGKCLLIGMKGSILPDEAGNPARLLLFTEDVTATSTSEERLKESESRFRSIFERAGDGMMMLDVATNRQVEANATICTMLGYAHDDLLGLPVDALHPPGDMPYVIAALERQVRGETSLAMDIPMLRKDGSVFYADVNAVPLMYRGTHCLLGVFRDRTGRKKAEEDIRESRERLETVIEAAPT